jgi:uncharacterized protein (DUF885 family)
MTSGNEGFPGHFLQFSISKHNADPVRRLSFDGVFSEGWAFYEEALLQGDGLCGDDLDGRYAVAQFERLRGARAIVDTKLATGAWSYEDAVTWFAANAGVDRDTARSTTPSARRRSKRWSTRTRRRREAAATCRRFTTICSHTGRFP